MATKPGLVPDHAPHLIVNCNDGEICGRFPTKREAFDWIFDQRMKEQDQTPYEIYAPDSRHEFKMVNEVVWEKSNG